MRRGFVVAVVALGALAVPQPGVAATRGVSAKPAVKKAGPLCIKRQVGQLHLQVGYCPR
jgi:hypothetical protein